MLLCFGRRRGVVDFTDEAYPVPSPILSFQMHLDTSLGTRIHPYENPVEFAMLVSLYLFIYLFIYYGRQETNVPVVGFELLNIHVLTPVERTSCNARGLGLLARTHHRAVRGEQAECTWRGAIRTTFS